MNEENVSTSNFFLIIPSRILFLNNEIIARRFVSSDDIVYINKHTMKSKGL